MKLIVGLGNPGLKYAGTRHNIGFEVVKALARSHKAAFKKDSGAPALSTRFKIGREDVVLALPLSFMNLSGVAVAALLRRYKLGPADLLVVCDDLDLEFGRLKIKPKGSAGGHNGLSSIINCVLSDEFARLRIGIGRPGGSLDAADYVLSRFHKEEKEEIRGLIDTALDCCSAWVLKGIAGSMNIFNRKN